VGELPRRLPLTGSSKAEQPNGTEWCVFATCWMSARCAALPVEDCPVAESKTVRDAEAFRVQHKRDKPQRPAQEGLSQGRLGGLLL